MDPGDDIRDKNEIPLYTGLSQTIDQTETLHFCCNRLNFLISSVVETVTIDTLR